MKTKLKIGDTVSLNPKPCPWIPTKTDELARLFGLVPGKKYTIVEIEHCNGCGRSWCPGLIRLEGMDEAECWGYSSGGEKWFGLEHPMSLDEILGLAE